ncbi:hypothetical protein BGZ65_000845 [Modicella reniformis]|uniref:Ion transport domain-containing protein n=1 Tax=Modicella reniformis TaxID=1440133 RepID=A0A9P6MBL1_9FUNG|nr:hypothetical protein BGZ65_000845 [Modicella reniformis]
MTEQVIGKSSSNSDAISSDDLEGTTSDCAVLRGYFAATPDYSYPYFENADESTSPIRIHPKSTFHQATHTFDTTKLDPGVYQAVWTISLACLNTDIFISLRFTATNDHENAGQDSEMAILPKDIEALKLKGVQGTGMVRLKVPTQVWIDNANIKLKLSLTGNINNADLTETQIQECYLDVYNVELHPAPNGTSSNATEEIIVLKEQLTAIQTIDVNHSDPSEPSNQPPKQVKIMSSQINGAGTHAATLSCTKSLAHIDLWTLNNTLAGNPWIQRSPCATATFSISRDSKANPPPLEIAISHDASKIAVFPSATCDKKTFPDAPGFQVFEYSTSFTPALQQQQKEKGADIQPSSCSILVPSPSFIQPESLSKFRGYGKFHFFDDKDREADDSSLQNTAEVFVACESRSVSVYSTFGPWSLLHSLPLALASDVAILEESLEATNEADITVPEEADAEYKKLLETINKTYVSNVKARLIRNPRILIDSLQGPFCAWMVYGAVSILNLRTAVEECFFHLGYEQSNYVSISPDGSMVAIVRGYTIGIYMMNGRQEWKVHYSSAVKAMFIDHGRQLLIQVNGGPALLRSISNPETLDRKLRILSSNHGVLSVVRKTIPAAPENKVKESDETEPKGENPDPLPKNDMVDMVFFAHGSRLTVYPLQQSLVFAAPTLVGKAPTDQERCDDGCREGRRPLTDHPRECTSPSGLRFRIQLRSANDLSTAIDLAMMDPEPPEDERVIQTTFHYGQNSKLRTAYFLPCKTRYLVLGDYYFQVWKLPEDSQESRCELQVMVAFPQDFDSHFSFYHKLPEMTTCHHGNTVYFLESDEYFVRKDMCNTWIEFSEQILYTPKLTEACVNSIPIMIGLYKDANEDYRKALLRYATKHINSYPDPGDLSRSVIGKIIWSGAIKEWAGYDTFLKNLLDTKHPSPLWYPRAPIGKEYNFFSWILELANKHPKHLPLVSVMIDYCTRMAKSQCDIGFLSLVIEALPEMLEEQPDMALDAMRKMAFIPVNDDLRNFVIDNGIASTPSIQNLWKHNPTVTWENDTKPVFRVKPTTYMQQDYKYIGPSQSETLTADVYMAPFELLWQMDKEKQLKVEEETIWWMLLIRLLLWKTKPESSRDIRTHTFRPEFFDNPAIEALLAYKWYTFAGLYWFMRFIFQCLFYLLVLITTLLQVFINPSDLKGAFIAIIAFSSVFLWLEFLQCMESPRVYFKSPYNYVDLSVYLLPLMASVVQLVENVQGGDHQNAAFSFTILVVYLHLLFELRVIEEVCYTVTIIINVMKRIKAFFIIFAASIFAFAHAFFHLIWDKKTQDASTFLNNFAGAISATYFFMGGRYDPVNDQFESGNVAFHIMMGLYFFLTVILMLNVLIALINVAFSKGDESWRLIWLENRFRFVENAENMTFHIPGFRRTHHIIFPRMIYYTATPKEVQEYNDKYFKDHGTTNNASPAASSEISAKEDGDDNAAIASDSMKVEDSDKRFKEIKDQLKEQKEQADRQYDALQAQMKLLTELLQNQQTK